MLKKDTLIFIFLDKTRFLLKTPLLKAKNFTSKKLSFPNACFFALLAVWMLELTYLFGEKQRHAGPCRGYLHDNYLGNPRHALSCRGSSPEADRATHIIGSAWLTFITSGFQTANENVL